MLFSQFQFRVNYLIHPSPLESVSRLDISHDERKITGMIMRGFKPNWLPKYSESLRLEDAGVSSSGVERSGPSGSPHRTGPPGD